MFFRDVVVLRGKPDQSRPTSSTATTSTLSLHPGRGRRPIPGPSGAEAERRTAARPGALPLAASLTLRRAEATGHAVWLQSLSQGTETRCNELIYKKLGPAAPDETYLRGDDDARSSGSRSSTSPQRGAERGQGPVGHHDPDHRRDDLRRRPGERPATIVARGPGDGNPPGRDQPVERRAPGRTSWVIQTAPDAPAGRAASRSPLTG